MTRSHARMCKGFFSLTPDQSGLALILPTSSCLPYPTWARDLRP